MFCAALLVTICTKVVWSVSPVLVWASVNTMMRSEIPGWPLLAWTSDEAVRSPWAMLVLPRAAIPLTADLSAAGFVTSVGSTRTSTRSSKSTMASRSSAPS